jgi:hypothetical protein
MGQLVHLPGTDGKPREAIFFRGHSTLRMQVLKNGKEKQKRAYTAAGNKGAINIWIDDDGFFRAERHVYMITKDSRKFKTFTQVVAWAKKAIKLIK